MIDALVWAWPASVGAIRLHPEVRILLYIAVAMVLGAVIGLERELADKPAGLRTHMLVAGASALLVGTSAAAVVSFEASLGGDLIRSDPVRILQAVITGVSFLGAGTIIQRGPEGGIEGLTTAASVLFASGVGVAVALEEFILAFGSTVLALLTLRGMSILDRWLARRRGRA